MQTEKTPAPEMDPGVPHTALVFLCPSCESALEFQGSRTIAHGDAPPEVNDYFRCPVGCGTFEHERRTHRMRLVEAGYGPADGR